MLGRSIISALDAGFKRAFATIVDSNVDDVGRRRDPLSPRLRARCAASPSRWASAF